MRMTGRAVRWGLAAGLVLLLALDWAFPPPLQGAFAPNAQVIVAQDGTPLRAFPDQEHIWRHPVRVDEVSPRYLEAVLAYEDRYFDWHPGVNPIALVRAGWQWLRHGRVVSGGSTLTMQVARMLEPLPRTMGGKVRQVLRALQLELRLSKREILALYLQFAPMGGVLQGVEAASRAYLGKPSVSLSHAEAALLAVLPQAPSRLRPDRYPERARAARDKVLARLQADWGVDRVREAQQEPVIALAVREPLLAPLLAQRLHRQYPRQTRVLTTLDVGTQTQVEQLLASRLAVLPPRVSMAALVVDNATLEVRAYAGSADFSDEARFSHVDMVLGQRSPGSTLKPFLYALALDEGLIHSESLLADVPQSFGAYQPGNFQANFSGPVGVTEALQRSLNVPAVEVLDRLGPSHFVGLLRRGGLHLQLPKYATPNLSVILGGAAVSLEQLVSAYTAFARQGVSGRLRLTPQDPPQDSRMMSEGAAFIVRDILESGGPVARQVEGGVGVRRGIAWKTGTSYGFRDAWSIGVSDRYTMGVWVGRPDGTPNPGFFGANIAAPLIVDLFAAIDAAPAPQRVPPPSVSNARICWPLGGLADLTPGPLCHVERTAWLLHRTAPPTFTDRFRSGPARVTVYRDPETGVRVSAHCATSQPEAFELARWPAVLEPWLNARLQAKAIPPAWSPGCASGQSPAAGLKIVGVSDGETVQRAPTGTAPMLKLETRGGDAPVYWLVNGRSALPTPTREPITIPMGEPGVYQITALDESGRYDRVEVRVR